MPGRFEFVFPPTHSSWANLVEGFFSTLTKQLPSGIRNATKEELRERTYGWFREFNAGEHRPRRWTWALDGKRYDIGSVDPNEAALRVVNGAACRPEDEGLRAARPKPTRKPRGRRAGVPNRRGEIVYEDGSRQLVLPIVWDAAVNFPAKEAAWRAPPGQRAGHVRAAQPSKSRGRARAAGASMGRGRRGRPHFQPQRRTSEKWAT